MRLHNRQIKATFWTDTELIKELPPEGRLFYLGLIQLADDSGCIEDDVMAFKIFLFPGDADITEEKLSEFRKKLVRMGKLIPYLSEGKPCLFLKNFHKHQTLKNPSPPEVPLPEWVKWEPYPSNPRTGKYVVSRPSDECKKDVRNSSDSHVLQSSSNQNLEPEIEIEPEVQKKNTSVETAVPDASASGGFSCENTPDIAERQLKIESQESAFAVSNIEMPKNQKIDTIPDEGSEEAEDDEKGRIKHLKLRQDVQKVMDFYNETFAGLWSRPLRLTQDRRQKIQARLKTFSVEELCQVIRKIRASPFHCGENDAGKVYATPEFIFRNDSMVDKWLKMEVIRNGRGKKHRGDPQGEDDYSDLVLR